MFCVAKAVDAVFKCDLKDIESLKQQYGTLLDINAKVVEAEMTLFKASDE